MYMSTISKRDVLRGSALFARLSDEETDAVLAHARIARYEAGDLIVTKGDPGDSMMAMLQGRVSISTTSEDGRQVVLSVLERRPDLCIALMLVLCERLRHTTEQVEDLAFLHLESRMAKALLRLLDESGAGQTRAAPAAIRISQRALGELVGGSRESVNKHLNAWKELGIVAIEKGGIVIRDAAALAEYAH